MDSEGMFIVTSVFKRSGKKKLSSSDIYLILSMDLGWFPPAEAKKFVLWAEENNLLKKEGDFLIPTFDLKTIRSNRKISVFKRKRRYISRDNIWLS